MSSNKIIYWRPDMPKNENGEQFANVHLIQRNMGSIVDFQKMADEIRATFPQANYENICASRVTSSSFFKGHSIVTCNIHIPAGEYPEWEQRPDGQMNYGW
jgi:hypothetical protein